MANSNSTRDTSSLETYQRDLDQDDDGDHIAHEALDQYEDDRNLWHFMEQWEAQQQQDNEPMEVDHQQQQEGGALDQQQQQQYEPLPPLFHFDMDPLVHRRSQRLGVDEQVARIHLRRNDVPDDQRYNMVDQLSLALTRAIQHLLRRYPDLEDRDRLYFSIGSNLLDRAYDGWGVTVGEWRDSHFVYRVNRVMVNLAGMLNSNESFAVDDSFTFSLVVVRGGPRGGGKCRKPQHTPGLCTASDFRTNKKFIVKIPDKGDNLCCAKALLVSLRHTQLPPRKFKDRYGRQRALQRPCFEGEARDFQRQAGIPLGTLCGADELTQFAAVLPDYNIVVIDADRCYECYRYGNGPTPLGLYYHDKHYDAVTRIPSLLIGNYWCWHCLRKYNNLGQHACQVNQDHCPRCRQDGCVDFLYDRQHSDRTLHRSCRHCGRTFYGPTCYNQHRQRTLESKPATDPTKTVCKTVFACKGCGKLVNLMARDHKYGHRCYHAECPSCRAYVDLRTHPCYLQTYEQTQQRRHQQAQDKENRRALAEDRPPRVLPPPPTKDDDEEDTNLYVFFDIETMQVPDETEPTITHHVPNLVVAETDQSDRQFEWYGEDCIARFCEQLTEWANHIAERDVDNLNHDNNEEEVEERSPRNLIIVLAHNFQGYDSYPIIQYYHNNCMEIHQTRNGGKVLELKVGKKGKERIRFIDSMSFLPMPLDSFTDTFDLNNQPHLNLRKGFFPHFFNTRDHQSGAYPLPERHYYGPDTMSHKRRAKFDRWYNELEQQQPPHVFRMPDELIDYCKSDVRLLKAGCLAFAREFQAMTHFSPFTKMTIASACSNDLRRNRLLENTIASEPVTGWRRHTNHSHVAMEWLTYQEHELGYPLQHARNGGEHRVRDRRHTYELDGYDPRTHTAYEFYGCFWHGCPRCYPQRTEPHQQLFGRNMASVHQITERREQRLRQLGYSVVTMWECQWQTLKRDQPHVSDLVAHFQLQPPLQPRDAFFGGRTNAVRLYVPEQEGQRLGYYDYTSLYPWVNKYGLYPVGHPVIHYNPPNQTLGDYFGLVCCTVLPPDRLFHPVLPYRCGGKLTFPLCRTCVETQIDQPLHQREWICHHTPEQRQLTGTWCTLEVEKALEKGYTLVQIHEVWDFPDRPDQRQGLFANYVNTWLKLKEEASGYPKNCVTPQQKRQHVEDYHAREGIRLDPNHIAYNGGKRAVAKLMLNSMWGKFGQRTDKTQVIEFTQAQDLQNFLASGKYNIRYVSPLTEDRVEVHYKLHDEMIDVSPNLNIFIACFTTCQARLKLYEALEFLKDRVLYFDTDSVVFVQCPGQDPPLGNYLGEFKNELKTADERHPEDEYITEFCSGGPKNYGYCTSWGNVVCKVRGFSLNVEGSRQLNYEIMKRNVRLEIEEPEDEARTTCVRESTKIVRHHHPYSLTTEPRHKDYRLVFNKRVLPWGDSTLDKYTSFPYGYYHVV